MSLLAFLGLRQPKYSRTPLTLADILHRTLVTGLSALSIYGIYLGYSVHGHVMSKGKGALARATDRFPKLILALSSPMHASAEALALKEAEVKEREAVQAVEEARERSLAEAAQAALPKRS